MPSCWNAVPAHAAAAPVPAPAGPPTGADPPPRERGQAPPPLPGPCVPVPRVRNEVHSRDGAARWVVETHTVPDLDLDGHGSPVVLVPAADPDLYPDTLRWTLYIMRGECGHAVGTIDGLDDPALEAGESHGLRNLSTLRPSGPGPRGALVLTPYTFDGRRYRAGKHRRR
ncbi:MAG TPA: hypothetical protein VFW96_12460 [Thermomicrobiales bacterium]|nr:hypothetical protein [Thermomicrobiales bacterium]